MNGRTEHSPALEILGRLPVTLELLVGSIALALAVGVAASIAASRRRGGTVANVGRTVAIALGCIPFFWLAFSLALAADLRWGISILGWASTGQFSVRDRLVHLIIPACVVALAEFPIVWKALEDVRCDESDWKVDLRTRVSLALRELAWRLPEALGMCLLTEMAFAWPGEGRLLLNALITDHRATALGVVIVIAVLTLLVRIVVGIAVRRDIRRFETQDA